VHVSINPTSATVLPGTTQAFTATVTGVADARATFSASAGSITTAGLFTAPTTPGTYTVTATSVVDPSQSATASVTVPNVVVALTPQTAILGPGGTQPFTATVSGTSNSGVIYSVQGAN